MLAASRLLDKRLASAMVQVRVDVFLPILTPPSVMAARVYVHACKYVCMHVHMRMRATCTKLASSCAIRVGVDAGFGQAG